MNYKLFMYRDRKLWAVREVKTAKAALDIYKVWTKEYPYYTIGQVYFVLLYYKNKRIKIKKIDKRS